MLLLLNLLLRLLLLPFLLLADGRFEGHVSWPNCPGRRGSGCRISCGLRLQERKSQLRVPLSRRQLSAGRREELAPDRRPVLCLCGGRQHHWHPSRSRIPICLPGLAQSLSKVVTKQPPQEPTPLVPFTLSSAYAFESIGAFGGFWRCSMARVDGATVGRGASSTVVAFYCNASSTGKVLHLRGEG